MERENEKIIIHGYSDYSTVKGNCMVYGIIAFIIVLLYTGQLSQIFSDIGTYLTFKDNRSAIRDETLLGWMTDEYTYYEVKDYDSLFEYLFRNFDLSETITNLLWGVAVYLISFSWLKHMYITVTNKRIHGKTNFGKQIDIPISNVTSASTCFLSGVCITTNVGTFSFKMIENNNEVQSAISEIVRNPKILEDYENEYLDNQAPPEKVYPDLYGKIICPVCNTEQNADRTVCNKCQQKFIIESEGLSIEEKNIKNKDIPVRVYPNTDGRISCPTCGTKQFGNRYVCLRCGQKFINGQKNIEYWCAYCEKEGPFLSENCPDCNSTFKIYNFINSEVK